MLFFLFMAVLPQAFLTLMSCHFVPFSLFPTWHITLALKLFNVSFNLVYKGFSRFESGNKVFRNNDCGIL